MQRALNSGGDGSKQNGGRLMQKEKEKVGEGMSCREEKGRGASSSPVDSGSGRTWDVLGTRNSNMGQNDLNSGQSSDCCLPPTAVRSLPFLIRQVTYTRSSTFLVSRIGSLLQRKPHRDSAH